MNIKTKLASLKLENKKLLFIPAILFGVFSLLLAIALKSSPTPKESYDNARLVDVQPLFMSQVAPEVSAYGRVEPKHIWQALSEVSGKITYRHPDLETGRFLKKDTLVLKVDPQQYQLKHAQAQANLSASQSELEKLNQEKKNTQLSLKIENQKLKLSQQEYKRKQTLKEKKLLSASDLANEKQQLLMQRNTVQSLKNALHLIPDNKKVLQAQIRGHEANLSDAERQLDNTQFIFPFDARIANVSIEKAQAVSQGELLFEAHKLGQVEIKAELSLQDANALFSSVQTLENDSQPPSLERLEFSAEIQLSMGNKQFTWPAKVQRASDFVSPEQSTIGFYLEVDQDLKKQRASRKPILTKGMFVTALIQGFKSQYYLIPEKALHGTTLYIMDKNNQLRIQRVEIVFRNSQGVAIQAMFDKHDQLVLNDLIPAVSGMALKIAKSEMQQ